MRKIKKMASRFQIITLGSINSITQLRGLNEKKNNFVDETLGSAI